MPSNRFTVDLSPEDDARFKRLTDRLGDDVGRLPSHRGLRYPSRADLLRALLIVAERDPRVRAEVEREVRKEGVRRHPSDELTAVANALYPIAPTLADPESQESLSDQAAQIEQVAGALYEDRPWASGQLHGIGLTIERLGARAGGYDGLRPLLGLAERLEIVRDAIEPDAVRVSCPRCRQPVRSGQQGNGSGEPEVHHDAAGHSCRSDT